VKGKREGYFVYECIFIGIVY